MSRAGRAGQPKLTVLMVAAEPIVPFFDILAAYSAHEMVQQDASWHQPPLLWS